MAGPAAGLLRMELHYCLDRRSAGRTGFRRHWLQRRQARPAAALDWAFSISMGWFCHGRQRNAAERFEEAARARADAFMASSVSRRVSSAESSTCFGVQTKFQ